MIRRRSERPDAGERLDEAALPGPAGGQVKRPLSCRAREPAGEREQPAADRARCARGRVLHAEHAGPPLEVVRQAGDHRPGGVCGEAAGGKVGERLVFEVADRELDLGVLAMSRSTVCRSSSRLVTNAKCRQ